MKLKTCPFCGSDAKAKSQRASEDSEVAWVECTGCEAQTLHFEDAYAPHDQAADYWNRRQPTDWVPLAKALFEIERDPKIKDQAWFDFQGKAQRIVAALQTP